jgi:hypothetical protein
MVNLPDVLTGIFTGANYLGGIYYALTGSPYWGLCHVAVGYCAMSINNGTQRPTRGLEKKLERETRKLLLE